MVADICGIVRLFLSAMGAWMITSPFIAVQTFGVDPSHMADIGLAPAIGARQLALGLIVVLLALRRKAGALGTVLLVGSIVPVADFLIAAKALSYGGAIRHLITLPFYAVLGVALVRKQ